MRGEERLIEGSEGLCYHFGALCHTGGCEGLVRELPVPRPLAEIKVPPLLRKRDHFFHLLESGVRYVRLCVPTAVVPCEEGEYGDG